MLARSGEGAQPGDWLVFLLTGVHLAGERRSAWQNAVARSLMIHSSLSTYGVSPRLWRMNKFSGIE